MDFITKLNTEFSTLQGEVNALLKESETRELTAEENTSKDQKFARMEQISKAIEERRKFAALKVATGDVITPKNPEGEAEFNASKTEIIVGNAKIDRAEFSKAALKWAISGEMDRKYATITTATQSGILLPVGVGTPQVNTTGNVFREAHALYGIPVLNTPGTGTLNLPVLDGSAGGVVAQTATSATENAPSFSESMVLAPETYESGVAWVSGQQIAANDFDILSYVEGSLDFSKELGLENTIVAALIADSGITQNEDCTSGAPTYANMVKLNNALPRRFDRLKVMVLDRTVISYLEGLTGSDGHPILTTDPQNQNLKRFNGTPILGVDSFTDEGTATGTMGVIISLLGFRLRDAGQRQVLRYQESAKPNQVGLDLVSYHAFDWCPSAVAKLKN